MTVFEILSLLKKNSRLQWREIGEIVHLTRQAVANRIRKMEDMGTIEGYTVKLNQIKLGNNLIAFITIFMKTTELTYQ
jgi:Lrp/AsnC family leucine-responsive transcriptional regulator